MSFCRPQRPPSSRVDIKWCETRVLTLASSAPYRGGQPAALAPDEMEHSVTMTRIQTPAQHHHPSSHGLILNVGGSVRSEGVNQQAKYRWVAGRGTLVRWEGSSG